MGKAEEYIRSRAISCISLCEEKEQVKLVVSLDDALEAIKIAKQEAKSFLHEDNFNFE